MNWDAIAATAEGLAALGVIVSLVYVGYQVRETKKAVKASVAQARTDLGVHLISSRYTSDIAEVLTRSRAGEEELSETDRMIVEAILQERYFGVPNPFCQVKP